MTLAGLSPVGTYRVVSGNPSVLHFLFTLPDGETLQGMAGRTFVWVVRPRAGREPLLEVDGQLSLDGAGIDVPLLGSQATQIYEWGRSTPLSYDLVETTSGGADQRWTGSVTVAPGPEIGGGVEVVPMWQAIPASQILVRPDTIVVSEKGAPGFSIEAVIRQAASMIRTQTMLVALNTGA